MAGELGRRVAVAVVGVPVVLAAIWVGGWPLAALLAAAAALGAHEFYGLARARGIEPFAGAGIVASGALVLLAQGLGGTYAAWAPAALALVMLLLGACLVAAVWARWPTGEPVTAVALTVAGAAYTGGTLAFGVLLRALPSGVEGFSPVPWHGAAFLLLPLLATWVGDTSAYFAGRAFGRRKLFPLASPGKTVAGGVAGLAGAVAVTVAVAALALPAGGPLGVGVPLALALGVAMGVAAQLGDVAESVMKRWAGVKDSGTILPGHGGILDRVDALLLSVPVAYGFLALAGVVP